ncbi:MAG TPA: hypothetical protein VFV36_07830 [Candidatus Methylomirabilis sp.]|nr:hypothetical protein [Candidatus Methylomirabilis sp.]
MRVVDAFPFFNEVELLRARVELLAGAVDHHVAVEGDCTHQGHPRSLALSQLELPPGRVNRGVVHLGELGRGYEANWARERTQRDFLLGCLLDLDPEDLVLLTDADEIPNPEVIDRLVRETEEGPVILGMRMIYYGYWEDPRGWWHAKAARVRDLPLSLTDLRLRFDLPAVPDAGWHLSYLGGEERLRQKVTSFAHAENSEFEVWDRIRSGSNTGVGPNGEQLRRLTARELGELPEPLLRVVTGAP